MVRTNPKFVPDAISIRLFGPGVIEETNANAARAAKRSAVNISQQYDVAHCMCLRLAV